MNQRFLVLSLSAVLLSACADDGALQPAIDAPFTIPPSLAVVDAANGAALPGLYFLPPLGKKASPEGTFAADLLPAMSVCELDGNPSAVANPQWDQVRCTGTVVAYFPPGSADVGTSSFAFSWDTGSGPENLLPLDSDKFYRIQILLGGAVLGYVDLDPKDPDSKGQGRANDSPDLVNFRVGSKLPVKFFLSEDAPCAYSDAYVIQCTATGIFDQTGGVLSLEPEQPGWPKLSVVLQPNALPGNLEQVAVTLERIDPALFLSQTGTECLTDFDAPQFGDCLRVTTDPVLAQPLDELAFVEMCIDPLQYPGLKIDEDQDDRLQIIRYGDDGTTQGLPNVDASTCATPLPSPSQVGLLPVPEKGALRLAALGVNRVARFLAPAPLAAHGEIRLAGATSNFSRFRWALPGQMLKESGDGSVIQQLSDGSEDYDVPVTVRVVDADGSDVEGATVHFSNGDDVVTDSDGLAATVWTVPNTPGVQTLDASALGLLDSAVPDHEFLITFTTESVTFSATVLPPCQVVFDGVVDPAEWACAESRSVDTGDPQNPGLVYWQNDGTNLYMAVKVPTALPPLSIVAIDLDGTMDGKTAGDDVLRYESGGQLFIDQYVTPCGAYLCRVADPTSQDGQGSSGSDQDWWTLEVSHPLRGTPGEDLVASPGDQVGFLLTLIYDTGDGVHWPGAVYEIMTIR